MTTTVENIDDLEALLAGLDDDELASLNIDDDVTDAELVEEPVAAAPKRAAPKRKLKPLPEDKPAVAPTDDLESELADLDLDDEPGVTTGTVTAEATTLSREAKDKVLEALNRVEAPVHEEITQDDVLAALEGLGAPGLGVPMDELTPEQQKRVTDAQAESPKASVADDDLAIDALLAASAAAAPAEAEELTAPVRTKSSVRPSFSARGELKTFIDADKLQDDLNFTTTNISLAMTRQASLLAHYGRLSAEATYQSDRCKQQVELHYANLDQSFRDSLTAAGTKFTEKTIEAMIIKDTSYQEAQTRAHEARAIAKMVETTVESFKHRRDMLIQVGADLRQEKAGSGLVVREHPGVAATRSM